MKVKVEEQVIGKASVNLEAFRHNLPLAGWNLKLAIVYSTNVEMVKKPLTQEKFITLIMLGLDWGRLIGVMHRNTEQVMVVEARIAKYEGLQVFKYSPEGILSAKTKWGMNVFLTNSLITAPEFSMKCFIDSTNFEIEGT